MQAINWVDIKQDWLEASWTQRILIVIGLVVVVLLGFQFTGRLW